MFVRSEIFFNFVEVSHITNINFRFMKKSRVIFMLIASCILSSCDMSNSEIIYSYEKSSLILGNVGGWGAEVKSIEHKNGIGKITFKNKITSIPESAFINCSMLKSITIPNSVTEIGPGAFRNCVTLTSITIPNGVTKIGDEAFLGCKSLESATIPNSITKIERGIFCGCESLRSITIPNCVTQIENGAFFGCESLRDLTIPYGVTKIGDDAFRACDLLKSITMPNSVTEIGNNTYSYCRDLESVTIPDTVTRIGDEAFFGCKNLSKVYCNATTPPNIGEKVFSYYEYIYDYKSFYPKSHTKLRNIKCKIYVPTASVNSYKTANGWSNYSNNIIGYDF